MLLRAPCAALTARGARLQSSSGASGVLQHSAPRRAATTLVPSRRRAPPLARRVVAAAQPPWAALLPAGVGAARGDAAAERVVRRFYAAVNARDLPAALALVDQACVYEDMIYVAPFAGKAAVEAHLKAVFSTLPPDMAFVIDDLAASGGGVGLTWHVELGGTPFPFGRGASFVRVSRRSGLIEFARDVPEPSSKPGGGALWLVALLSRLLRAVPGALPAAARAAGAMPAAKQRASPPASPPALPQQPPALPQQPRWAAPALWAVAAAYTYALLIGTELPGDPAWNIQPSTLQAVLDESLDFFYVAPLLDAAGVGLFPAPEVHPAELALFNFVNGWSFMFLGLLAADARCARLPVLPAWSGQMFLTNLFLLPLLAARASVEPSPDDTPAMEQLPAPLAALARSPALGAIGAAVGVTSVLWLVAAPVPGAVDVSVADRWAHLMDAASQDRLTLAFFVDCAVYSAAQAMLIGDARAEIAATQPDAVLPPAWHRFVPFFGLSSWLATRPRND